MPSLLYALVAQALAAPATALQVDLTSAEVAGVLRQETVAAVAERHLGQVELCARQATPLPPGGSADLGVSFSVRRGYVTALDSVVAPGEAVVEERLRECLGRKLRLWRFPSTLGESTVFLDIRVSRPERPAAEQAAWEERSRKVEAAADALARAGGLYAMDAYVLAALRGTDPCDPDQIGGHNEFAVIRCRQTADVLLEESRRQLLGGYLYVGGLEAELGEFDAANGSFPVTVDPYLIPGGLGVAQAPGLTLGRLEISYLSRDGSDFELAGGEPLRFSTHEMTLDEAEELAARTGRRLAGVALVRLQTAYTLSLRTDLWYLARQDPAAWEGRLKAGTAQEADQMLALYNVAVQPVAVDFYDPQTGEVVARWVAPGYALRAAEDGSLRPVRLP